MGVHAGMLGFEPRTYGTKIRRAANYTTFQLWENPLSLVESSESVQLPGIGATLSNLVDRSYL